MSKENDSVRNSHLLLMDYTFNEMKTLKKGKEFRRSKRFYKDMKRFLKKYDKMMGYK